MSVDEIRTLCRLCFSTKDLLWIFSENCVKLNLSSIIFSATSVEIQPQDLISQKICKKCVSEVLKINKFRKDALEKDQLLKIKFKQFTKNGELNIPNTSIIIKKGGSSQQTENKQVTNRFEYIHSSVKDIFKRYPNIKLPSKCLSMNMWPFVSMEMNEVENILKQHRHNLQEQPTHVLQTLESIRTNSNRNLVEFKDNSSKTERRELPKISHSEVKLLATKNVVSPISIKLTNPNKTEFHIVRKDGDGSNIKSSLKRKLSSRDKSPDCMKEIKRLESKTGPLKKENVQPSLMKSFELSPSVNKPETIIPVQIPYVEKPLAVCNICNAVFSYAKDLKKHKLKHLRCHFCKTNFKTFELKDEHIEKQCVIKKTMNSLPYVYLTQIEYNLKVRREYPKAFIDFPPTRGQKHTNTRENKKKNNIDAKNTKQTVRTIENSIKCDDEFTEIVFDNEEFKYDVKKNCIEEIVQTNSSPLSIKSTTLTNDQDVHLPNLSSSVVKPDIRIKNNCVLDSIDPKTTDTTVLKELLMSCNNLKLSKDKVIQPEVIPNMSITMNLENNMATLKGLKQQLKIYRVPIEIKHGSYKVSYSCSQKSKKRKTMSVWSEMIPTDLKIPMRITASTNCNPATKNQSMTKTNSIGPQNEIKQPVKNSFNFSTQRTNMPKDNAQNPHVIATKNSSQMNPQNNPNTLSTQEIFSENINGSLLPHNSGLNQHTVINHNSTSNQPFQGTCNTNPTSPKSAYNLFNLHSTGNFVHTAYNNSIPVSSPAFQNSMSFKISDNIVGNLGNNLSENLTAANAVNISYQPSNTVLFPQSSTLAPQLVYQNNQKPPIVINSSSDYLSYNPNNTLYTTNSSIIDPNTVQPVLVSPTPVLATTPVLDNSSMSSVLMLPPTSNVLTTSVISSISTTLGIPSLITSAPFSSSLDHSQFVQPTTISSSSTNTLQNSNGNGGSNVMPTSNLEESSILPDSIVQRSRAYIRVKNLVDLR